jgi:hypothetical protein
LKLAEKIETRRDEKLLKKLDKFVKNREYGIKMECYLALYDNKVKEKNRRIHERNL